MKNTLLKAQKEELESYYIYSAVAKKVKKPNQQQIFFKLAEEELRHYEILKKITKTDISPSRGKIWFFYTVTMLLGLTFGTRLFERSEAAASLQYEQLCTQYPEHQEIIESLSTDEQKHEDQLINMLDEEKLTYIGSIVLGLNDALVELTGALAGFTFAFQNSRIIALTGLITGVSASFSMAASEYLAVQHSGEKNSLKSSLYTGIAYIITVCLLITPFLFIANPFYALCISLLIAVFIILLFTFYISVAKQYDFKQRFFEMAGISLGVAALTFGVGVLIKIFIETDVNF